MDTVKTIHGANGSIKVVPVSKHDGYITERDAEMDARARQAVKAAVSKAKFCKKPVAGYDVERKKAYLQYPDGSRVDV